MQHYRMDPTLVDRTGRLWRQHPRAVLQLRQLHGGLRPLQGRHGLSAEDYPLPASRPVRPTAGIAGAVALLLLRHLLGHLPAQRRTGRADDGDPPLAGQPLRLDRPLAAALPVRSLGTGAARRASPRWSSRCSSCRAGWGSRSASPPSMPPPPRTCGSTCSPRTRSCMRPISPGRAARAAPRHQRPPHGRFRRAGTRGPTDPALHLARQGVRVRFPRRHAEALAGVRQRRARPVAPPLPARHRLRDDAAPGRRVPPGVPARRRPVPLDRAVRLLRDRGAARRHRDRDAAAGCRRRRSTTSSRTPATGCSWCSCS